MALAHRKSCLITCRTTAIWQRSVMPMDDCIFKCGFDLVNAIIYLTHNCKCKTYINSALGFCGSSHTTTDPQVTVNSFAPRYNVRAIVRCCAVLTEVRPHFRLCIVQQHPSRLAVCASEFEHCLSGKILRTSSSVSQLPSNADRTQLRMFVYLWC